MLEDATIDVIHDTGAACTMLAFALYKKLESDLPSLRAYKANLRSAGVELCDVQGEGGGAVHPYCRGVDHVLCKGATRH